MRIIRNEYKESCKFSTIPVGTTFVIYQNSLSNVFLKITCTYNLNAAALITGQTYYITDDTDVIIINGSWIEDGALLSPDYYFQMSPNKV